MLLKLVNDSFKSCFNVQQHRAIGFFQIVNKTESIRMTSNIGTICLF